MYATISVPQETKELIRRILRADQLTIAINLQVKKNIFTFKNPQFLQKNLQDTSMGRDLLESIDLICSGREFWMKPVRIQMIFLIATRVMLRSR